MSNSNQTADQDQKAGENTAKNERGVSSFMMLNAMPSMLASFLLNVSLILILALVVLKSTQTTTVSLEASEIDSPRLEENAVNLEDLEFEDSDVFESEMTAAPSESLTEDIEPLAIETDILTENATMFAAESTNFDAQAITELTTTDMSNEMNGRGEQTRAQLLQKYGGSAASESAVESALQWIADHQLADGSWNLDHSFGPTVNNHPRTSPNPGASRDATFGATALALLPFLGNGHTHKTGKYKQVVFDGLKFLMKRPNRVRNGLSYWDEDGEMYSHGLVSIVFAESFAMTQDEKLRDFVEGTINFISDAQDPVGGGWRYTFRQKGDTSAVGWQIMALKSAKLCGIDVNPRTIKLATKFLDSVSIDYGAYYGYEFKPEKTNAGEYHAGYRARTAVGLLCRMYMGWDRDRQGIETGVNWFAERGPDVKIDDTVNMYYNYYATQVMKHYEGEKWRKWNEEMRDFLVETQEKEGPAKGSWFFNPDGYAVGTLSTTATSRSIRKRLLRTAS